MNQNNTAPAKNVSFDEAQQIIIEKENADIAACVAEVNQVLEQHISPVLKKYGCIQTFRISGQGTQMQIQQVILKQK